jgi:hypothetical protein
MKFLIYLIASLSLLGTACEREAAETTVICEEGYHLNDLVPLPDGIELRVIEVNDNFCPCDVICVWGGFLEVIVQVEGANRGPDTLGWRNRVVAYGDYTVTLGEIYNQPECGGSLDEADFCFEVVVSD